MKSAPKGFPFFLLVSMENPWGYFTVPFMTASFASQNEKASCILLRADPATKSVLIISLFS